MLARVQLASLAALCLCELIPAALFGQEVKEWPGWDQYQVILWSTEAPSSAGDWLTRVSQAGFTAEQCGAGSDCQRFSPAHLGFYVENMIPELAFLHARQPVYQADWNRYSVRKDRESLIRKPCFDDPAFWDSVSPKVTAFAKTYAGVHPLAYDLRDEPSIGSFVSPMDYCFCPHTMRAFRQWLQKQYSSLAGLNQEWDTAFSKWDDVTPFTTFEIKAREKEALAQARPENYAPWMDHRAYMDESFASALNRLRSIIRKQDPSAPVGIAGAQMPSAWGGYDLWQISRAVDWIEPYDKGNSRRILRSFLPAGAPVLSTFFGANMPELQTQAWRLLFEGDRGAIVWDDGQSRVIEKSKPGMPLTDRGRQLDRLFTGVRRMSALWTRLTPMSDRIAIHYSQSSIRAHWMFDSREDGGNWLKRLASYEEQHSRLLKVRNSFAKVTQDLGLEPDFVSYEQIETGLLKGYKVLLLPQSVAMSPAECRNIEAFVRAGGTVVADNMVGTMDEHGRRLHEGCLDGVFGVQQKLGWKPHGDGAPGGRALAAFDARLASQPDVRSPFPEAPMVRERTVGRGLAIYLNLDMHDYGEFRESSPAAAAVYRKLFDRIYQSAGIVSPIAWSGPRSAALYRATDGKNEYAALVSNPETGSRVTESHGRIEIVFRKQYQITDMVRQVELGAHSTISLDWTPSQPVVLKLAPQ